MKKRKTALMDSKSTFAELQRRFVPPAGLSRSRPRDVRLTAAGRLLMVFSLVMFAAGLAGGIALHQTAERQADAQRRMVEQAVPGIGTVTRLWRASNDSKQPWVAYQFEAGGRLYEGRSTMKLSNWRVLESGATLPIRYLPADPASNVLEGRLPRAMPFWLAPLVAAAAALCGWLCAAALRVERQLLMDGRPAPALVTAVHKRQTGHGTTRSMTYTFPLLTGAIASGKCGTSTKPPAVGSSLCIVYDPDRPARNKPYPFKLVRV